MKIRLNFSLIDSCPLVSEKERQDQPKDEDIAEAGSKFQQGN